MLIYQQHLFFFIKLHGGPLAVDVPIFVTLFLTWETDHDFSEYHVLEGLAGLRTLDAFVLLVGLKQQGSMSSICI